MTSSRGATHYQLVLACAALTALAGCDFVPAEPPKPGPTGSPTGDVALLHAADPRICTAPTVEKTLREMLAPSPQNVDGYEITLSEASLQAFDAMVNRASCRLNVGVDGPEGTIVDKTSLDFSIAPSSNDPSQFIVSAEVAALAQHIADAIGASRQAHQRDVQDAAAASVSRETIKPSWLVGRWVQVGYGADACASGPYMDFGSGGRFTLPRAEGSWRMDATKVAYTFNGIEKAFEITDATSDGFSMADGGEPAAFRRCAMGEVQATQPIMPTDGATSPSASPP